jgi:hypothetical protein
MAAHLGRGSASTRCLVRHLWADRRTPFRITGTVASIAVVLLCMSCESPQPDVHQPPQAEGARRATDFDRIPGRYPAQDPDVPGADIAPVGACVSLSGPQSNPAFSVVDCGAPANGYRVVQRVRTPDECPADADQRFYNNPDGGQFTACLDYAWDVDDCLQIGETTATRVSCHDRTATNREKPTHVLLDSTSAADCPGGGFAHPVRRFTICTETQQ